MSQSFLLSPSYNSIATIFHKANCIYLMHFMFNSLHCPNMVLVNLIFLMKILVCWYSRSTSYVVVLCYMWSVQEVGYVPIIP